MRTRKASAALAASIVLLAAGCSAGGSTADSTTTTTITPPPTSTTVAPSTTTTTTTAPRSPLVLWGDATAAAVLEGYAADFRAATGIPVEIVEYPAEEIVPRVLDAVWTGREPDLFLTSHRALPQLLEEGVVVPVPIPDARAYLPAAVEAFTVGGDLFGLPHAIETPALYRNADIVVQDVASGNALATACETLDPGIGCVAIAADDPVLHLAIVRAFGGYGFGYGEAGFDTADVGLDTEPALAAADYIDARAAAGDLFETTAAAAEAFRSGATAFLFAGPDSDPGPGNWDTAQFVPPGADLPAVLFEVHGFAISAGCDRPAEAARFLTEFVGTDAAMFDFYLNDFRGPARAETLSHAIATDPRIAAFAPTDAGPETIIPNLPETADLLAALGNAIGVIYSQQYSEAVADARVAFMQTATAVRALIGGP